MPNFGTPRPSYIPRFAGTKPARPYAWRGPLTQGFMNKKQSQSGARPRLGGAFDISDSKKRVHGKRRELPGLAQQQSETQRRDLNRRDCQRHKPPAARRQEEFPEEYLWSGSEQVPDLLPDVLRCLSALNAKTDSEYWCPSVSVIVKLLKHIKERSACPRQRLAVRGRQLSM